MAIAPLLYLAPISWRFVKQRPQRLAESLARDFDVTYVEPVGLRSARPSDFRRLFGRRPYVGPAPPVPVIRPRYIPWQGQPLVDVVNSLWLRKQAAKWRRRADGAWILWTTTPSTVALALTERSDPSLVVYDCMDHYAAFHQGKTAARIEAAERRLLRRVDLVFASSRSLEQRLNARHSRVRFAPNGVDWEHFASAAMAPCPAALAELPRPVIGYQGTIGPWLDYPLIERLAAARPNWTWVFAGPTLCDQARRLARLKNVRLLGSIPYEDLPSYTRQFDAGVIPFAANDLTRHVYPIKALEYLAAGVPVVASPLPDLRDVSADIEFASAADEWLTKLDAAVASSMQSADARALRQRAARSHDWELRYASIRHDVLDAFDQRPTVIRLPRANSNTLCKRAA